MQAPLKTLKPYAILLLVLLVAYLPLSTFYFGMKNDAFSDNFPNKFFISQALSSIHIPIWNPYLNFGFPVYADMGFAFYNPITWLFALVGYNAYTLTLEVLLYIYLAGVFMFRLGRYLNFNVNISVAIAAMYMCSGFYTGCLDYINFLTAAAFLPLVIQALLQAFDKPCFKNSFVLAVAVFFVYQGGHPAIPIMLVYFVLILVALLFTSFKKYRTGWKKISLFLFVAVILFAFFYLPALYSYLSILPSYARNAPLQQAAYTDAGFTPAAWLSFIFPFATGVSQNVFGTPVSMCNGFFSVAGILCVLCGFKKSSPLVKVLLITAVLMLLLSAGGGIKAFIYSHLPSLNYIRYNGEFRVFAIVCFCVAAGAGLQRLSDADIQYRRYFVLGLQILLAVSLCIFVTAFAVKYTAIAAALHTFVLPVAITEKIKLLLASPFAIFLCVSTVITAFICFFSLRAIKAANINRLLIIIIIDVCINSILYLPITGVGQKTLKTIQAVYNSSPNSIPIPPLTPLNTIGALDTVMTGLVGDLTYYNKKIGTLHLAAYPSYFASTDRFFNDSAAVAAIAPHPYLFVKNNSRAVISVQSFNPRKSEVTVTGAHAGDSLVFLQNNYRFWHAKVNNNPIAIQTVYHTFIGVGLQEGENNIEFYYDDRWLFGCIVISILSFLTCLVIAYRSSPTYK
ncbi:MAG TPA: YfhO family protein [Chitinophagaceae bacterium]|nr:YfhO family protein [Chitinophagaceae bacterium]